MGSILGKPVTTKVMERQGDAGYRVGVSSMNGWRVAMEDDHSVVLGEEYGFFAVFDGHVGPACSKFMARRFPERLKNMSIPLSDDQLRQLSLELDKEFLDTGSEDGSTGTYFISRPTSNGNYLLQVGNVGDSRVIVGKGGTAYPMTTDHKPSVDGERVRIEAAGGHVANERVDGRLAVSRAYGDSEYKKTATTTELTHKVIAVPDVTHVEVSKDDIVFLSCDGVFERNFSNQEVISFVHARMQETNDLAEVCNMVCDEALDRGSKDNVSAMIVSFKDGTDYQKLPANKQKEYKLGPFSAPKSDNFRTAYLSMLEGSNLTLPQAVLQRYEVAEADYPRRLAETKTNVDLNTCDYDTLSDSELRRILAVQDPAGHDGLTALSTSELKQRLKTSEHDVRIPIDIRELQEELELFKINGEGPPSKESGTRLAWIENWLEHVCSKKEEQAQGTIADIASRFPEHFQRLIDRVCVSLDPNPAAGGAGGAGAGGSSSGDGSGPK
eukprot:Rhum_TRINITY_DN14440_c28_g1::Rhum_TRINITY_DN14440_c28_g1_i1::g.90720::m.90720